MAPPLPPLQGKYDEVELLYERCQPIEEKVLGPEHPSLAITIHNRAGLLVCQVSTVSCLLKVHMTTDCNHAVQVLVLGLYSDGIFFTRLDEDKCVSPLNLRHKTTGVKKSPRPR